MASLLTVPFREVRHFQPDDALHYERIEIRGRMHEWAPPAHCHEALHQFSLMEGGAVTATIDGCPHALAAPAAWMVPPRVMHGFSYAADSTGERVSVPSALLQQTVNASSALKARLARPVIVKGALVDDELRALFGAVAREYAGSRPGRAEALQAQVILLALWFARCEPTEAAGAAAGAPQDVLVDRYRALVEANFRSHRPVRDYAAQLGVTADHLSRRCRAVTGLGALELMQERLMLEARRLLAHSDAKLVDIAEQLGFTDPGYFGRAFARQVGQSPRAYREAVAAGLAAAPGA